MLTSARYLYVAFMCQQALEKIIKALYVNTFDAEPPRSHNLAFILSKSGIAVSPERLKLLTKLSAHYINNRYPEYKSKLSNLLDKTEAEKYLTKTEEAYAWLKSQII